MDSGPLFSFPENPLSQLAPVDDFAAFQVNGLYENCANRISIEVRHTKTLSEASGLDFISKNRVAWKATAYAVALAGLCRLNGKMDLEKRFLIYRIFEFS